MTNKKPVKKDNSKAGKRQATVAKSAVKAPVGRQPVAAQTPKSRPVAGQQPVRQAAVSVFLGGSVKQTPPPAPVTPVAQAPAPVKVPTQQVSGEELYSRIQLQAYLLGEKDGFKADPVHYWIQAERAVKAEIRHPVGN